MAKVTDILTDEPGRVVKLTGPNSAHTALHVEQAEAEVEGIDREEAEPIHDEEPTVKRCLCGCGAPVKNRYKPGHDAKHASAIYDCLMEVASRLDGTEAARGHVQLRVEELFDRLGTPALKAKVGRMVDNSKHGLYNSFGDGGVWVPHSTNPSLGPGHSRAL